jgi:hypothetical protein
MPEVMLGRPVVAHSPKTLAGKRAKVKAVMGEFKEGELHSSSGQVVTNPKQAVAIALSEAGLARPRKTRRRR